MYVTEYEHLISSRSKDISKKEVFFLSLKKTLKPWFREPRKVLRLKKLSLVKKKCYWETPWIDLYHLYEFGDKKFSFDFFSERLIFFVVGGVDLGWTSIPNEQPAFI